MSFLAKLYINDEVRNILNANQVFSRFADVNGRPVTKPKGGRLNLSIESTKNDSFFYNAMFSPTEKCKGEIVFFKRDGLSTLYKMEFANAYVLQLSEHFDASGDSPLYMTISIGWGILKMKGIVHEENWNPNNPFISVEETVISSPEKELIRYFVTDTDGNALESYKLGEKIVLNIETKNRIGDVISIALNDKTHDFNYNGEVLKNDKLTNYTIANDMEKITLEVVNAQ